MRHTDEAIERAGQRIEQLADELDPATAQAEDTRRPTPDPVASDMARDDEAPTA